MEQATAKTEVPKRRDDRDPADRLVRRRLWQRAVFALLLGMTGYVHRLDRRKAMRLGERLGNIAYRVDGRHRRQAERSLYLAYGDAMPRAEREAMVRRVFVNFGKSLIDFIRAPLLTPESLNEIVSGSEGFEEHVRPVMAQGKAIIALTGHIGNWEILARWVVSQGLPLTVVARDPEDAALGAYLRRLREGSGLGILSRGSSARDILRLLKRGSSVAILPDQNRGNSIVPFFGVPATTVDGPASLALHTGAVMIPGYAIRQPDDRYHMLFLPPIPAEATGSANDAERIMAGVNNALESVVRRYPDQWLWLHDRWRGAFEERNRNRWPPGYDYEALRQRWSGSGGKG